ncbi:MAG: 3-hydroxyacyl-CoA dehydrogenase NAD-binding domain-containing protein [Bacteroidota bacterium]
MPTNSSLIGVLGAGAMGSGIAQVAATAGHPVVLFDAFPEALDRSSGKLAKILNRLVEKGRMTQEQAGGIKDRITYTSSLEDIQPVGLVIEAIIENLEVKQSLFQEVENLVGEGCVIASNTSSLSITSLAGALSYSSRFLGLHFFNPAPLMPLVEVIPGYESPSDRVQEMYELMKSWGKVPVIAKDTPGFIVNRIARPFYGEALRMAEEGHSFADIDWAMKELGGFRMGPFELMDFIGNDINFTVTQTVFKQFFYDRRYQPSLIQQRMVEAGRLGRKAGKGYYTYENGKPIQESTKDEVIGQQMVKRIVAILINEAVEANFLSIATPEDIELAMTKGVNYPKGLLAWGDEWGAETVLDVLDSLYELYREDRYRASPLLRRIVKEGGKLHQSFTQHLVLYGNA